MYDKAVVVDALARESPVPDGGVPEASDFAVRALAPGVVLVTYRGVQRTPEGTERHALRSSIWKHAGGKWLMLFHQGSAISPPALPSG